MVSSICISENEASSITDAVILDNIDDYLDRLEAETERDKSLQHYLEWVQRRDTVEPHYQPPEEWLKRLNAVEFSNIAAVTNIRGALSFKRVDYLVLAVDEARDVTYFVTSDPAALRLDDDTSAESPGASTDTDQPKIHPALLSLSLAGTDRPAPGSIPKLFLPIGRLLYMRSEDFRQIGSREMVLKTPETIFPGWGMSEAQLISDMSTTLVERKWENIQQVSNRFGYPDAKVYSDGDDVHQIWKAEEAYIETVLDMLKNQMRVPEIRRDPKFEGTRRKLWEVLSQRSSGFRTTNYVIIVDAVTPGHPVWIVHNRNQMDDFGDEKVAEPIEDPEVFPHLPSFSAAQVLSGSNEWLESYCKLDAKDILQNIAQTMTRDPLVANTVEVKTAERLFSEQGAG